VAVLEEVLNVETPSGEPFVLPDQTLGVHGVLVTVEDAEKRETEHLPVVVIVTHPSVTEHEQNASVQNLRKTTHMENYGEAKIAK
jgi:hypothetical protein